MTEHDCPRSNVAVMDHVRGYESDRCPMVNRMCLACGRHWYGDAGVAVFEMPRKVWDGWMEAA